MPAPGPDSARGATFQAEDTALKEDEPGGCGNDRSSWGQRGRREKEGEEQAKGSPGLPGAWLGGRAESM